MNFLRNQNFRPGNSQHCWLAIPVVEYTSKYPLHWMSHNTQCLYLREFHIQSYIKHIIPQSLYELLTPHQCLHAVPARRPHLANHSRTIRPSSRKPTELKCPRTIQRARPAYNPSLWMRALSLVYYRARLLHLRSRSRDMFGIK